MMNNVLITKELDLCVSCGICKVVCPSDSIALLYNRGQYLPQIADDCNNCGLCLEVCPGFKVDFEGLYKNEKRNLPENILLGNAINAYVCYTKDEPIRKQAASGGMITTLIVELIKKSVYKGAFVLPFDEISTELAKAVYLTDPDLIISACKSKYLPASVENVIKEIINLKAPIVVGTSCQIHGIKQYCMNNRIEYAHVLFLGLFCEKTMNYNLLKYYQWKYGKGKIIKCFKYRSKEKDGWPGHTKLIFDDGEELFVDRRVRMNLKKYFQLKRCLFCIDKLNQMADISLGDCYIKGEETKLGQSNIIVRTEKGKQALEAVKEKFVLKSVDPASIASSQKIADKQQNINFCELFATEHNHLIYPGIQKKLKPDVAKNQVKNNLNKALGIINLGISEFNFDQIDKSLKILKVKKHLIEIANMFLKRIGVK